MDGSGWWNPGVLLLFLYFSVFFSFTLTTDLLILSIYRTNSPDSSHTCNRQQAGGFREALSPRVRVLVMVYHSIMMVAYAVRRACAHVPTQMLDGTSP